MRLITFTKSSGTDHGPRIGALIDQDRSVVDIQAVAMRSSGVAEPAFASMIALMEGGPAALDAARLLVDREAAAGGDAVIAMTEVTTLSPVPRPTQMRDFLCFEKHLRQAREVRFRRLADATENPDQTFEEYKARGNLDPPQIWYDQPIYYTCNALAVVGTGTDIV